MTVQVEIRHEQKRGCGYRRAGKDGVGIYLVGEGLGEVCERLPFPLEVCPTCHAGIKFSRGFNWIDPQGLLSPSIEPWCTSWKLDTSEHRHFDCVLCNPPSKGGLMWVGEKFYSPMSFVLEAQRMGISKRMSSIPRGFEVGKDWIYLAHIRAVKDNRLITDGGRRKDSPGIFYVFRPKAVELVIDDPDNIPDKAKNLVEHLGEEVCKVIVVRPQANQESPMVCGEEVTCG